MTAAAAPTNSLTTIASAILAVLTPTIAGAIEAADADAQTIKAEVDGVASDLTNHLITKDVAQLQLQAIASSDEFHSWAVQQVGAVTVLKAIKAGLNAAIGLANAALPLPVIPTI
jgi:hypothetical protein